MRPLCLLVFPVCALLSLTLFRDLWHCRRLRFWIADLLQVRMFLEFWLYLRVWSRKRGKRWLNHHFRSAIGFESFFVEMPSLVVQIYVLIEDPRPGTSTQAFAFIMTVCSAFIVLLHYFKYLHVTASVYGVMMTKVGQPCFPAALVAPIARHPLLLFSRFLPLLTSRPLLLLFRCPGRVQQRAAHRAHRSPHQLPAYVSPRLATLAHHGSSIVVGCAGLMLRLCGSVLHHPVVAVRPGPVLFRRPLRA